MTIKKLEYTKENLRLLASIIAGATSATMFTKLLIDGGWTAELTYQELYKDSKKNKEDYLYDEFVKIGESGREDILDYVLAKTISKTSVYFKKGDKNYKFTRDKFTELKSKLKIDKESKPVENEKLFKSRKFHKSLIFVSKRLFIDSHYSQAIFEACKVLENSVRNKSKLNLSGTPLMQQAFSANNPILKFNSMSTQSDKDEQAGFMQIYAGVMQGIRDPKGHSILNLKDRDKTLEYLSLISLLLRRVDEAIL